MIMETSIIQMGSDRPVTGFPEISDYIQESSDNQDQETANKDRTIINFDYSVLHNNESSLFNQNIPASLNNSFENTSRESDQLDSILNQDDPNLK